jgi:predicted metal-dependent phosphoesterase TrpH
MLLGEVHMFGVDLHLHTTFSSDSMISPKVVVDQLQAHPRVKGVAITDHNTVRGYFQVEKLARAYTDLVVLPGIEVSTAKGDLLVLGVEEAPGYPVTLDSVVDFAERANGVIVVPHPYRSMGIGELALDIEAHAIEILNPTATPRENMLARQLAKLRGLPGVAGTDAHDVKEMWTVYTEVEAQPTVDSVLDAIRRNLVNPVDARRLCECDGR